MARLEFIGTDERFQEIDSNSDSAVSTQEAIAADEWSLNEVPDNGQRTRRPERIDP